LEHRVMCSPCKQNRVRLVLLVNLTAYNRFRGFTKRCEGLAPCGGDAPWFSPVYPTLDSCCAELFGQRDPYYIFGSGQCFSVDEATVGPSASPTPEPSSLPSLEHSSGPSSSSMPSLEHSGGPSLSSVPSSSGNLRAGAPVSAAPTPDKTSTPSVDQSDQPSGSPSDVHSNDRVSFDCFVD